MTMKPENIAVTPAFAKPTDGSEHSLWIGGEECVLTITLNKHSRAFPPTTEKCDYLNQMIQGLARAAKDVIYRATNDANTDPEFVIQPVDDIADAIILLSQLSEAIRSEAQS